MIFAVVDDRIGFSFMRLWKFRGKPAGKVGRMVFFFAGDRVGFIQLPKRKKEQEQEQKQEEEEMERNDVIFIDFRSAWCSHIDKVARCLSCWSSSDRHFLGEKQKTNEKQMPRKGWWRSTIVFFSSFRWMSFFFCHFSFFQNCFSQFCKTKEDRSVISVNVYFLKNCRNRK